MTEGNRPLTMTGRSVIYFMVLWLVKNSALQGERYDYESLLDVYRLHLYLISICVYVSLKTLPTKFMFGEP